MYMGIKDLSNTKNKTREGAGNTRFNLQLQQLVNQNPETIVLHFKTRQASVSIIVLRGLVVLCPLLPFVFSTLLSQTGQKVCGILLNATWLNSTGLEVVDSQEQHIQ